MSGLTDAQAELLDELTTSSTYDGPGLYIRDHSRYDRTAQVLARRGLVNRRLIAPQYHLVSPTEDGYKAAGRPVDTTLSHKDSVESWIPENSKPEDLAEHLADAQRRIAKFNADIAQMTEERDREVHWYRRLRSAYLKHFPADSPEQESY